MRARWHGARDVVTTVLAGLGYRSMFHLPADESRVDVYRDLKPLPPQPEPIAHCFPDPAEARHGETGSPALEETVGTA